MSALRRESADRGHCEQLCGCGGGYAEQRAGDLEFEQAKARYDGADGAAGDEWGGYGDRIAGGAGR